MKLSPRQEHAAGELCLPLEANNVNMKEGGDLPSPSFFIIANGKPRRQESEWKVIRNQDGSCPV